MLAVWAAFLIRFEGAVPETYRRNLWTYAAILAALNLFFLWRGRLYAFTWAFVSLSELTKLLKAITYSNALFAIAALALRDRTELFGGFPGSVLVVNYVFSLLATGAIRIAKRALNELVPHRTTPEAVETLIVGAGDEGEALLRTLLKGSGYRPIGIVDNSPAKQNSSIHGVPVLGPISRIPAIAAEQPVRQVIIALTSAQAQTIREAVTLTRTAGIPNVKIVPATHELLSGAAKLTDLREIQVEDLLGRNPAKIDTKQIASFIKDRVVMVTGAAGSIGSELARQCLTFSPRRLILLDFNESGLFDLHAELCMTQPSARDRLVPIVASIIDRRKVNHLVEGYRPDIIFHAAAYKHVPLMEDFPEEAVATNVFGTLNVARAACAHGVPKFVLISTDKAIRPTSVMGKTKRAAEIATQALNGAGATRFIAVRFGNVIGSRGSVIPLFQEQIRRRAAITVTHPDMTRYFMTIPEAALLVMEAGAVGAGGEIFMLDMGMPVKIDDLARETVRLAGLVPDVDIPIVYTGVRSGEKIFEEIFSNEERRIGATQWDKIFITKGNEVPLATEVTDRLARLEASLTAAPGELHEALDQFVGSLPGKTSTIEV